MRTEENVTTTTTSQSAAPTAVPDTGCCPPFAPEPWDEKELTWHDQRFVKEHVPALFHVPLGMGRKVVKQMALIDAAHAQSDMHIMLSDDESAWGSELYIPVTKPVPGASMETLSGTFLTKVFEGPYREARHWADEMKSYVASKGAQLDKLYFGYTTCPKCAEAYGKNYVVAFAKLKQANPEAGSAPNA